ncbi:DUF6798 domain-containing protein [Sorangium sp. So ce1151]|uniref:DUF6798 domain-containing protein n=1 Tax=Sorangium sp. So ce1151 TaxID=3133332 RepID=UPI003F5DC40B
MIPASDEKQAAPGEEQPASDEEQAAPGEEQPASDEEQAAPGEEHPAPTLNREPGTSARVVRQWSWVVPCAVFGAILAMSRPFVINQNTYLVHAARRFGTYPQLEADWFAHTADPTPFFTWLVAPLFSIAGTGSLLALNALLGAACLAGLVFAAEALLPDAAPRAPRWAVACALAAAWLAGPWREIAFEGVAGQYVLRDFLQPSNFGVLLLCGLALWLHGRPRAGAAVAALAAVMHPTFVPSVLLIVGTTLVLDRRTPWRRRAVLAALTAALLAPPLIWAATQFAPSDPGTFHAAQKIIADGRIPHHTVPQRWLDVDVLYRALIVAAAILLARRSDKLRLGAFAAVCVLGTLAAAAFPQLYTLRLAFPWRISTWLVPLCTAVLCAALLGRVARRVPRGAPRLVAPGILGVVWVAAMGAAVNSGLERMRRRTGPGVALALEAQRRGALTDVVISPPSWEHLRLNAPVAIFADWKSHPYADREVLEWDRRNKLLRKLYPRRGSLQCSALAPILASAPAPRWVIVPKGSSMSCPGVELATSDRDGSLYRIVEPSPR